MVYRENALDYPELSSWQKFRFGIRRIYWKNRRIFQFGVVTLAIFGVFKACNVYQRYDARMEQVENASFNIAINRAKHWVVDNHITISPDTIGCYHHSIGDRGYGPYTCEGMTQDGRVARFSCDDRGCVPIVIR